MPVNIEAIEDQAVDVQPGVQQSARVRVVDDATISSPIPPQSAGNHAANGRFVLGNSASKTTGLHTANQSVTAQMDAREFLSGALSDEGEHPPTRRASLLAYRSFLHAQILQLSGTLQAHGQFDKRGRLRVTWLGQLESLINVSLSLDRLLGLDRRPRALPSDSALEIWKSNAEPAHENDPRPPEGTSRGN